MKAVKLRMLGLYNPDNENKRKHCSWTASIGLGVATRDVAPTPHVDDWLCAVHERYRLFPTKQLEFVFSFRLLLLVVVMVMVVLGVTARPCLLFA